MSKENENLLFERTWWDRSTEDLLVVVGEKLPAVGHIRAFAPIRQGYEDANFLLETSRGKYVLKVFLKSRSAQNVADYVRVIREARKVGVPVPELIEEGAEALMSVVLDQGTVYFMVSRFFEGTNFERMPLKAEDVQSVTAYLARLNTLQFEVEEEYDSWGNKNLVKEFSQQRDTLVDSVLALVEPVVAEISGYDLLTASRAVIHGDMQRKHVLKNEQGEYIVLDFGCMSFDPKIIDLSTYLAWFCLGEDTWDTRDKMYEEVIDIYQRTHHLTQDELAMVKPFIRASYAAYFMRTSLLIVEGDTSAQTLDWHHKSEWLLRACSSW